MRQFQVILLSLILVTTGCSREPESTGLTREVLLTLNTSNVSKICITSLSERGFPYHYHFLIDAPEKVDIFLRCMQEAIQITDNRPPEKPIRAIAFHTQNVIYHTVIGWDEDVVYGHWHWPTYSGRWESAQLREYFRQWDIQQAIADADPNYPFRDPRESPHTMVPWIRINELLMEPAVEFTKETFLVLDFSKVREVCFVVNQSKPDMQVFPIENAEKIKVFLSCIENAESVNHDKEKTTDKVYFVIQDTLFFTGIGWNEETVYGDWWKSTKLWHYLREWKVVPEK